MGKSTGLGDNLYVGGFDLSGDIGALGNISGGNSPLEVTAIDKSGYERLGGKRDGALEFTAFFNPDVSQEHAVFSPLPTADQIVSYFRGTVFGNAAACLVGKQISYDGSRGEDASLTFKVNAVANGFGLEWGKMFTPGKRTDSGATLGPNTDDNGVETTFGLQAYLQVFAFTGVDATVTVRGATDSGFTAGLQDQATFAVTSAPSSQRVAGGLSTVRRFLKINTSTSGGFTNLVFAIVVVRNLTATVF